MQELFTMKPYRIALMLAVLILAAIPGWAAEPDLTTAPTETVAISVDASKVGRPFTEFDRGCDPHWISWFDSYPDLFRKIRRDGFDFIRIMGVLSVTQMYTSKTPLDSKGNPIYDYSRLDQWMDIVVKSGLRPFLVMNDVPNVLTKHPYPDETSWKGLTNEHGVADHARWEDMIYKMFLHFQKRYGKEKVATWICEVWNEGDYGDYGFYKFDANFLETMDHTVNAIKRADSRIRVGGPGTVTSTYRRGGTYSKGHTIEQSADWFDYVEHTAKGKNYVTGKTGTPIDFISSHMYDLEGGKQATDKATSIFKWMTSTVSSFPEHAGKPVIISEWMGATLNEYTPGEPHARVGKYDIPFVAARALRTMVLARNIGMSGLVYHGAFAPPNYDNKMFTGYPSVYTLQGIRTPTGAVLSLYNTLEGNQVEATTANDELGSIVAVKGKTLRVLLYHCPDEPASTLTRGAAVTIKWPAAAGKTVSATKYLADAEHANARRLWHAMGEPLVASPDQFAQLEAAAEVPTERFKLKFDQSGTATIHSTLTAPAVQMLEMVVGR